MKHTCRNCGLEYDMDENRSCPRCDPQTPARFHTTVSQDGTKHVHLEAELLPEHRFEQFQADLKELIQEYGEVVVRDE